MPILTAQHLNKSFGPRALLGDVSLAIDDDERVGLIGNNGTGKSTLAKILAGLELADGGTVSTRRGARISYLEQEPVLAPTSTAYDLVESGLEDWKRAADRHREITAAIDRGDTRRETLEAQSVLTHEVERLGGWEQGHRVREMLDRLGIRDAMQTARTMSGGERRRVALARLLVSRPALALLDEPTNHLDADTAEWLEMHLRDEFPGALVLITHDRYFLDHVVTRVFELDRGSLFEFEGNYSRYLELKAERLEHEARVESNRLNILRRERDWLSRGPAARTTKQRARIDRAAALEATYQAAKRSTEHVTFDLASADGSRRLLETHELGVVLAGRTLFDHVNLVVSPGDRVGIIGPNGAGKTTLLRTLLGAHAPTTGTVTVGPRTKVMYFDQQRSGIDDARSVIDNVAAGRTKVRVGSEDVNVHAYLERFLFDGARQRQAAGSLSGGERARLALAKMLQGDANLLVLDEPTNDLDLVTLATLEEMLEDTDVAVLAVTHDRYFLDRVATSILAFEHDGRVVRYAGNYSDARQQRRSSNAEAAAAAGPTKTSTGGRAASRTAPTSPPSGGAQKPAARDRGARKDRAALTYAERLELAGLPEAIDAAEKQVARFEQQLNDPTIYNSRALEVSTIAAGLDAAKAALEVLMSRWEALESKSSGTG